MKKIIFIMATILLLSGLVSPTVSQAKFEVYYDNDEIQFADVLPNNSHYGNITRLADKKIIMGTGTNRAGEKLFAPNDKVTNRQVAIMLGRALNLDMTKTGKHRFTDVSSKDSAFKAIHVLTEMGLYDKTKKFNPASYATRQEVAKTISKAFKLTEQSNIAFKDIKKTDSYYPYIQSLAKAKITVADSKGNFNPKKAVTRAQFATFLQRTLDLKQYLNQTVSGQLSQGEKLQLAENINEGREVYYDKNLYGDPSEVGHFLYNYFYLNNYPDNFQRDSIETSMYYKSPKKQMDIFLKETFNFTIENPELYEEDRLTKEPVEAQPFYYENGYYYTLDMSTQGNWGYPHKILIDNAIQVEKDIYYGLAYNFVVEEDEMYRQNIDLQLPFSKWKESHLKTVSLDNYYYFVAKKRSIFDSYTNSSYERYEVLYRDRDGFKTKNELDEFISKFDSFK